MERELPVFYTPDSFGHNPPYEVWGGEKVIHKENVSRLTSILDALRQTDFANINVTTFYDLTWVEEVHTSAYLEFLKEASNTSKVEEPIVPSSHPYGSFNRATNPTAKLGRYVFDTFTPIMPDTYRVALASAACAVAGAKLLQKGAPLVYALSRPPGHHAGSDYAGGYCYINNTAVAAEFLLQQSAKKIAVLDIDYHHGNGTQDIFYERPEVFVLNIHAHPDFEYPGHSGYEDEYGGESALGTNYNYPFPAGIGEEEYGQLLNKALRVVSVVRPDYLLVSAGFDTHRGDPTHSVPDACRLSTGYFRKIGREIASLGVPTLSIQEGGYDARVLGPNVVSYLEGLREG